MPPDHDLRRLEELGLNSSAPPGQLLYDGWLLRLLPGQAKRARSVNAVYPSTRPLAEKLAYCELVYRSRDLPLIIRITPFSEPAALDQELARLGYTRFDTTAVEATGIDPARLLDCPATGMALPDWVEAVGGLRNSPRPFRTAHLQRLQGSPLQHRAMVIRDQGAPVASGLVVVEDGWAGLFDIATDANARRNGYGRQIVHGLLRAAWELGARQAYLQVTSNNTPARTLYRQFGFEQRYQYWYRGQTGKPP